MLLENQSTVDVFHNRDLLENIHTVDHRMYIHCNAGTWWTNQRDLPGYGRVWYCPKAKANILSPHNVSRRYRVESNSEEGNRFVVIMDDGKANVFRASANGLYHLDAKVAADKDATVLVTQLTTTKRCIPMQKYPKAEFARALQRKRG